MKYMKRAGAFLIAMSLILGAGTFTGCGKSDNKAEAGNASNLVKKDDNQYLNLFMDSPLTLDPNDARNASEFQIITQVQEGLARVTSDAKGEEKLEPAGAESWEISKDGLIWTFHLRENKWSDGKSVTAQNYVDSIIRLLNPDKAFSYAFFAYDIKNGEAYYNKKAKAEDVGVKAIDDKTLQITLEKPAPQFEKKIAFACLFPIRLDAIKTGGETWATDFKKQVYCGPFVIKDWVKDNSITLEKNPNYWDAKNVSLSKVNMTIVSELSTQAQLFDSQQMDVIQGQNDEYSKKWDSAAKEGKLQAVKVNMPSMNFIGFNQKTGGLSGLMQNANVRKALSLSINREDFVKTIYGKNRPGYGLIPYGIIIGKDEFRSKHTEPLKAEYDKYNGDKAKLQDLFKQGLKELGKSEDLSSTKLVFITTGTTALDKSTQEYWKQTLENTLGIKIDMQAFGDSNTYKTARNANKYDIINMGWNGDYNDPMTFSDIFISNSGFAKFFGYYSSKEYDDIFKKLDGEADINKRSDLYSQLEQQLVVKDAGIAPYMYGEQNYYTQNYVKNIYMPMFGPAYDFSRAYTQGRK